MQYRTETQLRQELEDVWQMYHATKRGAQAAIEAAVAAKRERSNEIGRLAIRALCAWDESVLPKSNDGMMQERMEDLRAALAQQAERDALLAALKKDDSVTAPPIWETLAEIGESAPAGTWDVLPAQLTDKEARELWVLFQLRVALGDPTGELMQDELVERARNAWADAQLYRMQRTVEKRNSDGATS